MRLGVLNEFVKLYKYCLNKYKQNMCETSRKQFYLFQSFQILSPLGRHIHTERHRSIDWNSSGGLQLSTPSVKLVRHNLLDAVHTFRVLTASLHFGSRK